VQKELAEERRGIRDFVRSDALLRRFFDVFLFEDLPASDRRADEVYLDQVGRCAIYVGLFGQEYGLKRLNGATLLGMSGPSLAGTIAPAFGVSLATMLDNISTYADETAALAAGLVSGQVYRRASDGPLYVVT